MEEALREIRSLKEEIQSLTREIESLRKASIEDAASVEGLLRTRGLRIFRKDPTEHLFFPPDLSLEERDRFFKLMKKYSFRLVLRDMIKYQDGFGPRELTRYCSPKVVKRYCEALEGMGILLKRGRQRYRLRIRPLFSFGPTLEWFIAEMFKKEFASPALYGVSVKKTRSGGDFDVVASWNRRLVYVEVKSSPPRGIEQPEITTFFSRLEDLLPDVAILFNDTQLRMKDKLVGMFEEELQRRYGGEVEKDQSVERLIGELFHIQHRIYLVNSKRDVVENFSICLRDFLKEGEARA